MVTMFPGTTIETLSLQKGASRILFDGLFAAGGITLSQVCVMTGLEPYMIQNWVKRGFVSPPQKRQYSKEQFVRILILNLLRDSLQLDRIAQVLTMIGEDVELYHAYVDLYAVGAVHLLEREALAAVAAEAAHEIAAAKGLSEKPLAVMLQVMACAHRAALSQREATDMLATMM